eukprot:scaffold31487_cov124-Isochrysis_galbana.AAC.1
MPSWEKASNEARVAGARKAKAYGGAAGQVVKSHVQRQQAQSRSRELRALLPPPCQRVRGFSGSRTAGVLRSRRRRAGLVPD